MILLQIPIIVHEVGIGDCLEKDYKHDSVLSESQITTVGLVEYEYNSPKPRFMFELHTIPGQI